MDARRRELHVAAVWGVDGKQFQVYLKGPGRLFAAQHATYGAYRTPGKGLAGAYVKPKRTLKRNTGAWSVLVMASCGADVP